ncbi:hypothetical protein NPIL_579921 [Nephila pilipes]|uniref:Uncharacterized protein n=1 Tax=Nephila pilipes TaxID=299642 RepID=A0A8X6QGC7_NEPPI|nr:hypothetical protein NPIL_579921 [Nephila pilipes]
MAHGGLYAAIMELVTPFLEKPYISFCRERERANFHQTRLTMSLADGHKSEVEINTTNVVIRLEERIILTPLIALPFAKRNSTLLGMDFYKKLALF